MWIKNLSEKVGLGKMPDCQRTQNSMKQASDDSQRLLGFPPSAV
jgi:hypothetical protein